MKNIILIIFLCASFHLYAQNPVLHDYIIEGLESNIALQVKRLEYNKELEVLKEARGLFFPDISLTARYTLARGGRVIEFPVGDLLNPVYSTLNQILMEERFPQIENESFNFYREYEHETKLSMVQPIFSADLVHNAKIKKQGTEIRRVDLEMYKRELILEITRAYYNYQQANQLSRLIDSTRLLVDENLRVSMRLMENDMLTKDVVYRSEAESAKVEAEAARARKQLEMAKAYFNFLLNRELNSEIELLEVAFIPDILSLEDAKKYALENREELAILDLYAEQTGQVTKLHKGRNIPGLYGMLDYGFQGETYSFTNEDDFILASLVLKWDLFKGFTNRAKIQQSKIDGEIIRKKREEAEQQIQLEVISKYYEVLATLETIEASKRQKISATTAYSLILRKYKEGQSSLLELIDARTNMTQASTEFIVAKNDYFIGMAEFQSAIAEKQFSEQ